MNELISYNNIEDQWLGIDTSKYVEVSDHMFYNKDKFLEENIGLRELLALRDPQYFGATCHYLLDITLPPFQMVIQEQLWKYSFPMFIAGRGASKTFSLGLHALLSAVLYPGYKIVLAGAVFRQSKMIFDYIETIWNNAPVLRSMCNKRSGTSKDVDKWTFRINDSLITAIPIGNTGDKVRGLRANEVIVDEFSSHNAQIVEEVLFGFAAVKASPVENLREVARRTKLQEMGYDVDSLLKESNMGGNKSIIAGTADYYFNHFYEYWVRYKKIIESRGDPIALAELFGGSVPEAFDWEDFCIIRLPYSMLPKGFMDDKVIARAKSQMSLTLYNKEYEAIFVEDSDGFFKRSIIESCVANEKNIVEHQWDKYAPYCMHPFDPVIRGNLEGNYVMGVDPAAQYDNFAISILEVYHDHSRIVYCWTTNSDDFVTRKKNGLTTLDDYYSFCASKIIDLSRIFPCRAIGIDTQGGGYSLIERLSDHSLFDSGEDIFLPIINYDKEQSTDNISGRHIIHLIQFASAVWLSEANWGLQSDLQSKSLLFPRFDPITAELSIVEDKIRLEKFSKNNPGKQLVLVDSLEDCVQEIEDLKDELTNVVYSRTQAGRERWDTPEIQTDIHKKVRGKKDRYSALIIANNLARSIRNTLDQVQTYSAAGGLVRNIKNNGVTNMYNGPEWYTKNSNALRGVYSNISGDST